ncbi:hypothetical protein [Oceanobacillus kimchii]|uniref:Uncharacterized protein n=1 Tax=Oceanobacillus kimchii TaxID=746691 RepID=A0ABQ5THB4_9BACI|nr:hypothetical protein [Oceanobacillus kimchii]GLO66258.1 hypothetical protein MACH08_20420 [Oceanobacillus kimchii]
MIEKEMILNEEGARNFLESSNATKESLFQVSRITSDYEKRKDDFNKDIKQIEEENVKMEKSPTKEEYELALETIEKYKKRQSDLKYLNRLLGEAIRQFESTKFEVNKAAKKVEFIGLTKDGKLKHTVSQAKGSDVFEEVIGKLIAIYNALGKDTKFLEEYIEQKERRSIYLGGIGSMKIQADDIKGKYDTLGRVY